MQKPHLWRAQLLWGLLLIAAGLMFLLDRLDILFVDGAWRYWPFLCVIFGINKMVGAQRAEEVLSGLWGVFFGFWFFISFEHIWGATFGNSWPFLLIAWGIGIVLKPLLTNAFARNHHEQQ